MCAMLLLPRPPWLLTSGLLINLRVAASVDVLGTGNLNLTEFLTLMFRMHDRPKVGALVVVALSLRLVLSIPCSCIISFWEAVGCFFVFVFRWWVLFL